MGLEYTEGTALLQSNFMNCSIMCGPILLC